MGHDEKEKITALYPNATIFALESLRSCEINFSISHFFDEGWEFKLGDSTNGYLTGFNTRNFKDGVDWLWQAAEKHFPDAECFL